MAFEEAPTRALVRKILLDDHIRRSALPLEGPDDDGVFPRGPLPLVAPVVVDANVLRNDLLYSCRNGKRTTLVNAAGTGVLRVYCARHVPEEVEEYAVQWASEGGVSFGDLCARWRDEYLAVLRVVDVPEGLLHPDEARRVAELRCADPDDVPSATLALLLEAVFVSEDRRALKAVHGRVPDDPEAWRVWLGTGGDAGRLGELLEAAAWIVVLLGGGMFKLGTWATRVAPWLAVPFVGGVALAVGRLANEQRQRLRDGAKRLGIGVLDTVGLMHELSSAFAELVPSVPTWTDQAAGVGPDEVLVRACARTFARAKAAHYSAAELAGELPRLDVPQGEQRVRSALRHHDCFHEVYRGRWQLGVAFAPSAP